MLNWLPWLLLAQGQDRIASIGRRLPAPSLAWHFRAVVAGVAELRGEPAPAVRFDPRSATTDGGAR